MKDRINQIIDAMKDDLIRDVCEMVQINSIRSDAKEGMPYGEGVDRALKQAITLCEKHGLTTHNVDGHMVYGQLGEGEDYTAIVGHLDVVEVFDGWKYPPFSATIEDNRIYGRGALDNKGPLISAFYGLLAFKKLGVALKRPIRIVFGGNEETGMQDIRYYLSKEKAPLMGFTPDNKFPAVYGERGRAVILVQGDSEKVVEFSNLYLMNARNNGEALGINIKEKHFGEMIIRGKKLVLQDGILGIQFVLSYPLCNLNEVVSIIQEKARDLKVTVVQNTEYMMRDPESKLVQTLNRAYNEMNNDDLKPTTTTGHTYAHYCPNIIPFGPSFPGQNGIAHLPNEWMDIDDLVQCAKTYAYGLYLLNELD